jgi:hypothetical protein
VWTGAEGYEVLNQTGNELWKTIQRGFLRLRDQKVKAAGMWYKGTVIDEDQR